jgi:hypothetical protein
VPTQKKKNTRALRQQEPFFMLNLLSKNQTASRSREKNPEMYNAVVGAAVVMIYFYTYSPVCESLSFFLPHHYPNF